MAEISVDLIVAAAEQRFFHPRQRFAQLAADHVPFDLLTGREDHEAKALRECVDREGVVGILGPRGGGKSSLIAHVCRRLPDSHLALRVPVSGADDPTSTSAMASVALAQALVTLELEEYQRRALAEHRADSVAATRTPGGLRGGKLGGGPVPAELHAELGSLRKEVHTSSLALDRLAGLDRLITILVDRGLRPVFVLEDTEAAIGGTDTALAEGFLRGPIHALVHEVDAACLVAVQDVFEAVEEFGHLAASMTLVEVPAFDDAQTAVAIAAIGERIRGRRRRRADRCGTHAGRRRRLAGANPGGLSAGSTSPLRSMVVGVEERRHTEVDGRRLAWRALGNGPPLLLINGYAATAADWDPGFLAGLTAAFDVIAPDNRGVGGSDLGDEEVTVAAMAADCEALLDAAGVERAAVAGWSMGGFVAQALAARAPQRVDGLALIATDPGGAAAVAAEPEAWARLVDRSGTPREQASRLISLLFPPALAPEIDRRFGELVAAGREGLSSRTLSAQEAAMSAWHREQPPAPADGPRALVVHGGEDVVIPAANAAALARRWSGAPVDLVPGCGHAVMAQEPARVAAAIRGHCLAPAGSEQPRRARR